MNLTKNKNSKTILIIVAHTDDEELGMVGTIEIHYLKGDKVYAISMTDGISSRRNHEKIYAKIRKKMLKNLQNYLISNGLRMGIPR